MPGREHRFAENSRGIHNMAMKHRIAALAGAVLSAAALAAGNPEAGQAKAAACGGCHGAGALGSPKLGDAAAWGARLAQGYDTLTEHAIKGLRQMPPRGGGADLTDVEVKRAVAYMANAAGAKFAEPPPAK